MNVYSADYNYVQYDLTSYFALYTLYSYDFVLRYNLKIAFNFY